MKVVIEEFVAYLFLAFYDRSLGAFEKQTKKHIKQYWYDKNFNQPFIKR